MTLDKLLRWAFFCAGMITAIFAGYMFYTDNIAGGAAWLAVAVGFLSFATRLVPEKHSEQSQNPPDDDSDLHDLAALIAEVATMSLQNIGRTAPPTSKEIDDMEYKLTKFLDTMPLDSDERAEIADKFEALRNRSRRAQGGRALLRSARL